MQNVTVMDKSLSLFYPCCKNLSDEGMPVTIDGQVKIMHGTLVVFSADNLGAHSIFGFLESFSANKFCRFCEAPRDETQENFSELKFQLRTKENYEKSIRQLTEPRYDASSTGIKAPVACISSDTFISQATGLLILRMLYVKGFCLCSAVCC
jgi:hypothetical protein